MSFTRGSSVTVLSGIKLFKGAAFIPFLTQLVFNYIDMDDEEEEFVAQVLDGKFEFSPDNFNLLTEHLVVDDDNLNDIELGQDFAASIDFDLYLNSNSENVLISDAVLLNTHNVIVITDDVQMIEEHPILMPNSEHTNNVIAISDDEDTDDVQMIDDQPFLITDSEHVPLTDVITLSDDDDDDDDDVQMIADQLIAEQLILVPNSELPVSEAGVNWELHNQLLPDYIKDFQFPTSWFNDHSNVTNEVLPPYESSLAGGQASYFVCENSLQNMRGYGHTSNQHESNVESAEFPDSSNPIQTTLDTPGTSRVNAVDEPQHNEFKFIKIVSENIRVERWLRSFSKRSTTAKLINVNTLDDLAEAFDELAAYVRNSKF